MELPMFVFVIIVLSSQMVDPSFTFDDFRNYNHYPNAKGSPEVKSYENENGEIKRSFMMAVPTKYNEKPEEIEREELEILDDQFSLIRKVRCKYPRPPRKHRRTTIASNQGSHVTTLRTVPIVLKNLYNQHFSLESPLEFTQSPPRVIQSDISISRGRNRENEVNNKILQPRNQDPILLDNERSRKSNDEAPKRYICRNVDKINSLLRRRPANSLSSGRQRKPVNSPKRGYINDGIPGESSKTGKSKNADSQSQKSFDNSSSKTTIENSKTFNTYSQRLQRALCKKTDFPTIPCMPKRKSNEPTRIGIPLLDPDLNDGSHQPDNQESSLKTGHEYPDQMKSNYEAFEPIGIQPNVLYSADLLPYIEDGPGRGQILVNSAWQMYEQQPFPVFQLITPSPPVGTFNDDSDQHNSITTHDPSESNPDRSMPNDSSKTNDEVTTAPAILSSTSIQLEVIDNRVKIPNTLNQEARRPRIPNQPRLSKSITGLQPSTTKIDNPMMDSEETLVDEIEDYSPEDAFLTAVVQQVLDDYQTGKSNSPQNNVTYSEIAKNLAIMQRLFGVPEVQDLILDDSKRLVSDMGDLSEFGLSLTRLADSTLANVINGVLNSLSLALQPELMPTSKMAEDLQLYSRDSTSTQSLKEYLEHLIHKSGIEIEQAKSPLVENIIFRTVEHSMKNSGIEVDDSIIWDTLKDVVTKSAPTNSFRKPSMQQQSIGSLTTNAPGIKKLPIIPIREHVYENGRWIEKATMVGQKKLYPEAKGLNFTSLRKDDQKVASTSEQLTMGALGSTGRPLAADIIDQSMKDHSTERSIGTFDDESSAGQNKYPVETPEDQNAPIKYYSPIDRLLAYRKMIQNPDVTLEKKDDKPAGNRMTEVPFGLKVGPMPTDLPDTTEDSFKSNEATLPPFASNPNMASIDKCKPKGMSSLDQKDALKDKTSQLEVKDTSRNVPIEKNLPTTKILMHPYSRIGTTTAKTREEARDQNEEFHDQHQLERVGITEDKSVNVKTPSWLFDQSSTTLKYNPTFLGRIISKSENSDNARSNLSKEELFYMGDNVKIPLKLTKMADSSWSISISDKICENFIKYKCPCCIPNDDVVIEKKRRSNECWTRKSNEESSTSSNPFPLIDQVKKSMIDAKGRRSRSFLKTDHSPATTKPVSQIGTKNRLIPDLRDFLDTQESMMDNIGTESINPNNRTESKERGESSIIAPITNDLEKELTLNHKESTTSLPREKSVSQSKNSKILTRAANRLINSVSSQSLSPILDYYQTDDQDKDYPGQDHTRFNDDYDFNPMEETSKDGYEKNNPILDMMKFTKQVDRRPYRYQRYFDHEARERVDAMTNVLHWLKEVLLKSGLSDDT